MAGIAGHTAGPGARAQLDDMVAHCVLRPDALPCAPWETGELCVAQWCDARGPKATAPFRDGDLTIWFDGEVYLDRGPVPTYTPDSELWEGAEWLARGLRDDPSLSFLAEAEGSFRAVVFDARAETVTLLTDKHGLRSFAWTRSRGQLWFAPAPRAMLAVRGLEDAIDERALVELGRWGHLTGEMTLQRGVEWLPLGAALRWSLSDGSLAVERYWSWHGYADIVPTQHNEARGAEAILDAIEDAVARRVSHEERLGLTLSGGMDSRALLAAVPRGLPLHTTTFGMPGCRDVAIGHEAASVRGSTHHSIPLTSRNWMEGRELGVWHTDGQFSIEHMQIVTCAPTLAMHADVNLDGFLGDSFISGSYLHDPTRSPWDMVTDRARRFINEGRRLTEAYVGISRTPLADDQVQRAACDVPTHMRGDQRMHARAFARRWPELFADIPWQKTGAPAYMGKPAAWAWRKIRRAKWHVVALAHDAPNRRQSMYFSDYATWTREDPAASTFEELLGRPLHILSLPGGEAAVAAWRAHASGDARHTALVCQWATLELWLRQVAQPESRPLLPLSTSSP